MPSRTFESRIALAMLPIGAMLTLLAVVGAVGAVLGVGILLWCRPAAIGWWLAWDVTAGVASGYMIRRGIETMSTFDWRVAFTPLAIGVIAVALCPAWWL